MTTLVSTSYNAGASIACVPTRSVGTRIFRRSGSIRQPVHACTFAHCCSSRFGETGIAVPSFWAKSETRYSSSIHRKCSNSGSTMPCDLMMPGLLQVKLPARLELLELLASRAARRPAGSPGGSRWRGNNAGIAAASPRAFWRTTAAPSNARSAGGCRRWRIASAVRCRLGCSWRAARWACRACRPTGLAERESCALADAGSTVC